MDDHDLFMYRKLWFLGRGSRFQKPIDTVDGCEILHLLVDGLSHYNNPIIYHVSYSYQ